MDATVATGIGLGFAVAAGVALPFSFATRSSFAFVVGTRSVRGSTSAVRRLLWVGGRGDLYIDPSLFPFLYEECWLCFEVGWPLWGQFSRFEIGGTVGNICECTF